jgi:glucose/arabinose dehydrogenase
MHTPRRAMRAILTALVCLISASLGVAPSHAAPPTGFISDTLVTGLNEPTGMTFLPSGQALITTRLGIVHLLAAGASTVSATPALTLSNINTAEGERGLTALALDPDFATNSRVYLFYTANSPLRDRVSRFTWSSTTLSLTNEVVIWQDNVDAGFWHHGGSIAFDASGMLYITVGDHFDTTVSSSHVSQRLDSYHGKILRINRDGSVPTDNPFYDGAGPNLDAIWARGLRNPFRLSFDATSGVLYIGDVGGNEGTSSEEINIGAAGVNYGWPLCEGSSCTNPAFTSPAYSYTHNGRDASITGGLVYRGTQFPVEYRGRYFFGDYAQNWIRTATLSSGGLVVDSVAPFEPASGESDGPYGSPVHLTVGPDGSLYYTDIGEFDIPSSGSIRRIRYATALNLSPTITSASASPNAGLAPLPVTFNASATDPESAPLTYTWDLGNGQSASGAQASFTYTTPGVYTARVSVSDGANTVLSAAIPVVVGSAPQVSILSPAAGSSFQGNQEILFAATATDDGPLTDASYAWAINFIHEGHTHPGGTAQGPSGSFIIPTEGHSFSGNTAYDLSVTVTDAHGLSTTRTVRINPLKTSITVATNPAGGTITVDGASLAAPATLDTLLGFHHTLSAPSQQVIGGVVYQFTGWSDGGAREHTISAPMSFTYTANYAPASAANQALLFDGGDVASCSPASYPRGALTVEGWARPATGTEESVIIMQNSGSAGWSLELNNGLPTFWVVDGGGTWRSVQGSTALAASTWAHLAATYDGSTATLFVNGQIVASGNVGSLAPATQVFIGSTGAGYWYSGQIDDLRVSTTVRYTSPFTPLAAHPLDESTALLYRFDEGSGQVLVDTAGRCSAQRGSTTAADSADPTWVASTVPGIGTPVSPPPVTATPIRVALPLVVASPAP